VQKPAAAATGGPATIQQMRDAWPQVLETVQRTKRSAWAAVYTSYPLALKEDVLTLSFLSRTDVEAFKRPVQTGGGVSEVLRTAILEVLGVRVKFLPRVDGGAGRAEAAAEAPADPAPAAPAPTPATVPVSSVPISETPPDDPEDVPPPPDPAERGAIRAAAPVVAPPEPRVTAPSAAAPRAAAPPVAAPPVVSEPLPPAGWGSVPPPPAPEPEPPVAEAPVAPVVTTSAPPVRPDEHQRYGEAVVREILGASFLEETVIVPSEVPR
jgi:DNA polymerase-3 subunit gamma/tau